MASASIVSRVALPWLMAALVVGGCGGRGAESTLPYRTARARAGVVPPQDAFEQQILTALDEGQHAPDALDVGGRRVLLGEVYEAASRRTCRSLYFAHDPGESPGGRLVCNDGEGWFYTPSIFGASRSLQLAESQGEAQP